MHHSLRFYSRYQELFLRYYIFQAKWTRIPLVGRLVRAVANLYGKKTEAVYVLTTDQAREIVNTSARLALGPCACRHVFGNCTNPINAEIMVFFNGNPFIEERPDDYREITPEEAGDILSRCHQQGLIHTLAKCRGDFYAICNCCTCCCVPLRLSSKYGIGNALVRSKDIVEQFRKQAEAAGPT